MAKATVIRPPVTLQDDQSALLSTHDYEYEAVVEAELQTSGTYTVQRPTTTINVEE